MKTALIGHSGFVGSNIKKQKIFSDYYDSQNIKDIEGKTYDLIVSAANSSLMWKVNQDPKVDWENIKKYIEIINTVKANHFILISTVEVYDNPIEVTEESGIKDSILKPYGKHRYKLEKIISSGFQNHTIVRMPNL